MTTIHTRPAIVVPVVLSRFCRWPLWIWSQKLGIWSSMYQPNQRKLERLKRTHDNSRTILLRCPEGGVGGAYIIARLGCGADLIEERWYGRGRDFTQYIVRSFKGSFGPLEYRFPFTFLPIYHWSQTNDTQCTRNPRWVRSELWGRSYK